MMPSFCFNSIWYIIWHYFLSKSIWSHWVSCCKTKIKHTLSKSSHRILKHLICFSTKSYDYVCRNTKKRIFFTKIVNHISEILVAMSSVHFFEHFIISWLKCEMEVITSVFKVKMCIKYVSSHIMRITRGKPDSINSLYSIYVF